MYPSVYEGETYQTMLPDTEGMHCPRKVYGSTHWESEGVAATTYAWSDGIVYIKGKDASGNLSDCYRPWEFCAMNYDYGTGDYGLHWGGGQKMFWEIKNHLDKESQGNLTVTGCGDRGVHIYSWYMEQSEAGRYLIHASYMINNLNRVLKGRDLTSDEKITWKSPAS